MTLGTTPDFGPNTDGSKALPGSRLGDPYRPVCEALHALLTRKRGYYGCPEEGPLDNARGVQEQGIEPWIYQLARIGEKVRRAGGLHAQFGTLTNRDRVLAQVRETLMDIAGHAIVAIALLDNPEEET